MRSCAACVLGMLFSAASTAVMLDPSGRGQVLIYPYYTVNNQHQTLFSVVNHGRDGKALKLRFLEARNGRETLSLNLYLGAHDVWTAALFALDEQGAAALVTYDRSCTVPALRSARDLPTLPNGTPYRLLRTDDFSAARADGGPADAARTREGYFEIIEMGTLVAGSAADTAVSHTAGGPDCAFLESAWHSGYWAENSARDLAPPSGQLSGSVSWIRVDEGAMNSVAATALNRFSVVVQHSAADAPVPNLASAVTEVAHARVQSTVIANGRLLRSFWPPERAIDAVSVVLMKDVLVNSVHQESALDARSEWIISMPTKRFYLDAVNPRPQPAPFTAAGAGSPPGSACVELNPQGVATYNTAQYRIPDYQGSGLPPPVTPRLCYAVQATGLGFSATSLLGSRHYQQLHNGLTTTPGNGQMQIDLGGNGHMTLPALGGEVYRGLPVIGFHAFRYANVVAQPGLIGRYAGTTAHRGMVHCERNSAACTP